MGIFSKKSTAVATGAACASAACAIGVTEALPESMKLTKVMKEVNWSGVPLVPIDFNSGVKLLPEENAQQQLKDLAAKEDKPLNGFDLFGIIKETGVDDAGLEVFHKDHYPYPLYKDLNLKFYEAFGNGSFADNMTWNPFKGFAALRRHNQRHKEKGLEGNLKGDGIKTGGVIIFGKDGSPQFMAPEQTGTLINEDELLSALEIARKG